MDRAIVSQELLERLNGHPDRSQYQRLVGKEVKIIKGSEFKAKGRGIGKTFVRVVPLDEKNAKPLPIAMEFLEPVPLGATKGGPSKEP